MKVVQPWILFGGDGMFARVFRIFQDKNCDNEPVWKMRIQPTLELVKMYSLAVELLDSEGTLVVEYPLNMVLQLSRDPANQVYFCYLNFKGQETEETYNILGHNERQKVVGQRRIIDALKAENFYWREKAEIASSNAIEFMKKYVEEPASMMTAATLNAMQSTAPKAST